MVGIKLYQKFIYQIYMEEQLKEVHKEFNRLKDNNDIPPSMQPKLEYLCCKIWPKEYTKIPTISQEEASSLDQLTKEAKAQIFISIIGCLSGKEILTYFTDEKAFVRKDQTFSMWSSCYISANTNTFTIKKKPDSKKPLYQFPLQDLRISKNYRQHKKKTIFGATYKKSEYLLIGFQIQLVCVRTHKLLRSLIYEKSHQQYRESRPAKKWDEKMQNKMTEQDQYTNQLSYNTDGDAVDEQMMQILEEYELVTQDMYLLKKHEGDYRQFVHKNYPNVLKQVIFMDSKEKKTSSMIFSLYLKMNQWNSEVQSVKFLKKLSDNGYLIQVRIKKYNIMAWPRSFIAVAKVVSYKKNSYLIIRSIDQESEYDDTVTMVWSQLIQVCQTEDQTKVLITIASEFDFKGYCSNEDSREMGLKVLQKIKLFQSIVDSTGVCGQYIPLFQLLRQKKPKKPQPYKEQQNGEETSSSNGFQQSQFEISNVSGSQSGQSVDEEGFYQQQMIIGGGQSQTDPMDFIIYMMKSDENAEISPKLIELLNAKINEKYYLKHRFNQKMHLDLKRCQHSITQPNHYFFQNESWKLNQKNQAIFINQEIMDMQKDTIKMVVKQMASHVMSGKSIMNMSLPCELFQPRSVLQRIAMGFGYAPSFLMSAAKAKTVLQQAKYLTAFIISQGILHTNTRKPFNPILGQTFQCLIGGIPLYLQQISHHPPISSFYMETEDFKGYGNFSSFVELGLNQITGCSLTPIYFQFKKLKTFFQVKLSYLELNGLVYGDKKYRPSGLGYIHERNNNIFVEYNLGKDKKKLYPAEEEIDHNKYYGGFFKVTEGFAKKFKAFENKSKFDGLKPNDVSESYMKISGFWNQTLYFDQQEIRTMNNPIPNKIEYPQYVLPSDSNFREDIIYKRMGDLKQSNHSKEILENIQRNDRKLREGQKKKK